MGQSNQDKLKCLKLKLDKHHLDQLAQLNAQKALIDNDISAFMQDMAAGHQQVHADKLEDLRREFEKFQADQKKHKESVLKEIQKGVSCSRRAKNDTSC